ncbi:MAG TPA: hypothetical protein DD723_01975 [Candidatus Omnitrophica bacterium]|nr:MAG: hypothetical protein A2Z81_09010 [Omnitrophica WOR_2 bacterium GWA2_45_18]HBR14294.1 hypothetical protein [Candidatus Omnitrophota bacterium]
MIDRVKSEKFLRFFLLFTFLLSTQSCALNPSVTKSSQTFLKGTFIQLLSAHQGWTKEDWEGLFAYLRQLKVSYLIVQWSVFDKLEFFNDGNNQSRVDAPLNFILNEAEKAGMNVFVGLELDPDYWNEIARDTSFVKNYLADMSHASKELADRLAPLVKKYDSFQGWYITQEIDDSNWRTFESQQILFDHLNDLGAHLHKLFPDKRVALSGFCNAEMTPGVFELFWDSLLKATPIDIVLFQDGIGADKLTFAQLPEYLASLHRATQINSRQLQVVVELFKQVTGNDTLSTQFAAEAAELERVQKQIMIDAAYGSDLVAFSIPEYMTPLGGPQAEKLFKEYLKIRHP